MPFGLAIYREQWYQGVMGILASRIKERFCQRFAALVDEWLDSAILEGVIWSDGELAGQELSLTTAELLRNGGSLGAGVSGSAV